jgi:hypothetical protein
MESSCLAFSLCIEIYTSGVGFGFSLLCPYCWRFELFFFSWSSSSVPQRGVCLICYPLQSSCCSASCLLSTLSEEASVPTLWWGHKGSPVVTVGRAGSLCTVGGRPPSTRSVADCHLVEELGFLLFDRIDMTFLQGGTVWSSGFLSTLGEQGFWCCLQISRL